MVNEFRGVDDGESEDDVHDENEEQLQPAEAKVDVSRGANDLLSLFGRGVVEAADLVDAGEEDVGDDLRGLEEHEADHEHYEQRQTRRLDEPVVVLQLHAACNAQQTTAPITQLQHSSESSSKRVR